MPMNRTEIEFTKDGRVYSAAQVEGMLRSLDGVTDLFVVAHGWNNDIQDARVLYGELLGNIDKLLDARSIQAAPESLKRLKKRTYAACQVLWPSKVFTDAELIPGGGVASATGANDAALLVALDRLATDPERLGDQSASPVRRRILDRAKALVASLEGDEASRREFVFILRSLLDPDEAHEEDGSDDFFAVDPEQLFTDTSSGVTYSYPTIGSGGAAVISTGASATAGFDDLLTGAKAAARRLANFATYYQMKSRAGTVGSVGLAPVLRAIRHSNPNVRIHLVGHSFGGRLVVAAAHALESNTPTVTISLLQAAFSHNGFSQDFDSGKAGSFRQVVSEKRASGPIMITHTKNDRAVGVAYPLASRIARQNASAFGDQNDPYGGMGRNGAQRTAEAEGNAATLAAVGHDYVFKPGKVHNVLADEVIKDHGDVRGIEVAYAILSLTGAV